MTGHLTHWQECLKYGADTIRFECCLDKHGRIGYVRSIRRHSGVVHIDPKWQNNVQLPHGRTDCINHVGSSWDVQVYIRRRTFCKKNCNEKTTKKNVLLQSREPDEPSHTFSSNGRRQVMSASERK